MGLEETASPLESRNLVVNDQIALYVGPDNSKHRATKGGCMKQVVWGAAAVLSVCVASSAFAQAEAPGIDQRQGNQEKRIEQGIASGQLNER